MKDYEELQNNILGKIKAKFEIERLKINFQEEFYYPKYIHLLKLNIEQYNIKDLGNMAILRGKGFGIMKIFTVIFTPTIKKDIPFVIIDFIRMANKRTVFVEFYFDYLNEKNDIKYLEDRFKKLSSKYDNIENYIEEPNWYTPLRNKYSPLKKTSRKDDSILYEMVLGYLDEYLNYVRNNKVDLDIKNEQLEKFINDLIYKGNPSAVVLEKALGKEETIRLFKEIIFNYS